MTTADVIAHLNGKWATLGSGNCIVYRKVGNANFFEFWDDRPLSDGWQRICTKQEFEAGLKYFYKRKMDEMYRAYQAALEMENMAEAARLFTEYENYKRMVG